MTNVGSLSSLGFAVAVLVGCGGDKTPAGGDAFKRVEGTTPQVTGPDLKYAMMLPSDAKPCDGLPNACFTVVAGEQRLDLAITYVSGDSQITSEADAKSWVNDNFKSNLESGGEAKRIGSGDFSVELRSEVVTDGVGVVYFAKGKAGPYLVARCFGRFDKAKVIKTCHSLENLQ